MSIYNDLQVIHLRSEDVSGKSMYHPYVLSREQLTGDTFFRVYHHVSEGGMYQDQPPCFQQLTGDTWGVIHTYRGKPICKIRDHVSLKGKKAGGEENRLPLPVPGLNGLTGGQFATDNGQGEGETPDGSTGRSDFGSLDMGLGVFHQHS